MFKVWRRTSAALIFALAAFAALTLTGASSAQRRGGPVVLEGDDLTRVVPTGFYFEKQSAPTQMRNASAVQWGRGERARLVIAGLVDTSGYSSEVRAKYQGFFIADAPVTVGGQLLATGAYGFGFTGDGRINIFDVSGRRILSARASKDSRMQRPRPLMFTTEYGDVRLYSGRDYAVIVGR
jgi:hypothetical protein